MVQETNSKKLFKQLEIQHPHRFWIIALLVAVLFDQIFWDKTPGLLLLLTTLLILIGGFVLLIGEKKHIPWQSYLLLLPIVFSAAMTCFRLESLTNVTNVLLTFFALFTLGITVLNGEWLIYRMRDYALAFLRLLLSVIIDPIRLAISAFRKATDKPATEKTSFFKRILPYLRGVLIAAPLLLLLGVLLAAADPIFSNRITNIFAWFKIEDFGEYIFRTIYVLILAYALLGAYLHALTQSADKQVLDKDKPLFQPFLGKVEALIVLISINLLFAAFVIIQFRYFFGGEANISYEGFTYSEYARRGFFELIAVALISLLLFYGLSMITRRQNKSERLIFSTLGILLMLQVGVMLFSAFQRLSLYESMYGFTQLRTITHIFMVWLAILLAATVVLEAINRLPRLALVIFLVIIGFSMTLNLINIDSFIAKQNIQRAADGYELDTKYLGWNLSRDAVPAMFKLYLSGELPDDIHDELGAVLACRSVFIDKPAEDLSWVSYHFSKAAAADLYSENAHEFEKYSLTKTGSSWYVEVNGERRPCLVDYYID